MFTTAKIGALGITCTLLLAGCGGTSYIVNDLDPATTTIAPYGLCVKINAEDGNTLDQYAVCHYGTRPSVAEVCFVNNTYLTQQPASWSQVGEDDPAYSSNPGCAGAVAALNKASSATEAAWGLKFVKK